MFTLLFACKKAVPISVAQPNLTLSNLTGRNYCNFMYNFIICNVYINDVLYIKLYNLISVLCTVDLCCQTDVLHQLRADKSRVIKFLN